MTWGMFFQTAVAAAGGTTALVVILLWPLRKFGGSYLAKLAENIVARQTTAAITRIQEEIKSEFAQVLEQQRAEAQL